MTGAESSRVANGDSAVAEDWYSREVLRLQVAREILVSERRYVAGLQVLGDVFHQPLHHAGLLFDKVVARTIVRCVHRIKDGVAVFPTQLEALHSKHAELLTRLEDRMRSWKWQGAAAHVPHACSRGTGLLGDIFARFSGSYDANVLFIYTQYVHEFAESIRAIRKVPRARLALPMCNH